MIFGIPVQALFGQLLIGLINGSFYAMLSLGLAIIFGLLQHHQLRARRAVHAGRLRRATCCSRYLGIGYWPALILAPLIVGLFGAVIERLALRRLYGLDPLYGLLFTFGLALVIEGTFRYYYGASGQPYATPPALTGATNLGFMFLPNYRGWVVVASLIVCLATWLLIEKTRLGAYLRAATENRDAGPGLRRQRAAAADPDLRRSAAGSPRSPAMLAAPIYQVSPLMGSNLIIVVFAVVVVGGMGSIIGRDRHRLRARPRRGPDQGVLSGSVEHRDLRHHGDRAPDPAGGPLRQGA